MVNPLTPNDAELNIIAQGNSYLVEILRDLFDQTGTLSPDAIEEALIAAGTADSKAVQALDILERIANTVESLSLAPQKEDIKEDDLTLADLAPRSEEDPDGLTASDIGDTVQAFSANLDTYAANSLTEEELTELQNINSITVTNDQWAFLGNMNQNVTTTSSVTFNQLTITGKFIQNFNTAAVGTITSTNASGAFYNFNNGSLSPLFLGFGSTLGAGAGVNDGVIRYNGSNSLFIARASVKVAEFNSSGELILEQNLRGKGDLTIDSGNEVFLNLPVVGTGTSGSLWNDSGTVKVVP